MIDYFVEKCQSSRINIKIIVLMFLAYVKIAYEIIYHGIALRSPSQRNYIFKRLRENKLQITHLYQIGMISYIISQRNKYNSSSWSYFTYGQHCEKGFANLHHDMAHTGRHHYMAQRCSMDCTLKWCNVHYKPTFHGACCTISFGLNVDNSCTPEI